MKGKSILLFLCFLLVISASAQNQDKVIGVHHEIKLAMEDENPEMITQVLQRDKPGAQILTCYTADDDGNLMQMIELSDTDTIYWVVEYTGVYYDADASFHFIITGPEFFYYQTDFFEAKYKNYYYAALETNDNWKKGTYTMTVIAELEKNRAGSECVGSCRVRIY
ncbi:MAG: hypothetical protein PVH84_03005 [Candidatus Aminicenantes bacterium]|jgi:hypothetical protein